MQREKDVDLLSRAVEENVSKITEAVRIANIEREENDADILKKIGEGLQLISQRVVSEKQNRESSEQAVYDLLKDVVARVKVALTNGERDRGREEGAGEVGGLLDRLAGGHLRQDPGAELQLLVLNLNLRPDELGGGGNWHLLFVYNDDTSRYLRVNRYISAGKRLSNKC